MSETDQAQYRVEAGRWFAISEQDIAAARLCLGASPPLIEVAAYHCQQAVEKIIKAMLVAAGVAFPKTHDLASLSELAGPIYPSVSASLARLEEITVWGFAYRYPPEEEGGVALQSADVERRLRDIDALRKAVATAIRGGT